MQFYSPYATSFDRNYESSANTYSRPVNDGPIATSEEASLFGINDLGKTIVDGRDQGTFVQSIGRAIREGAGRLELQPGMEGESFGAGVENYSKEQRREIRELAKLNNVELQSVHTPIQIGNISGFNEGTFTENQRDQQLNEVKKHIDFAGDVTQGGSIVVHTGEFPRSISEDWGKQGFEAYPGEKQEAIYYLVDKRTGKVVHSVKKDEEAIQPVWRTNEGEAYEDEHGKMVKNGDYVDYYGNKTDIINRVPVYDEKTGRFETTRAKWEEFEQYAKRYNEEVGSKNGKTITPQEAFYTAQVEAQEKTARGWAINYGQDYDKDIKALERLKKQKAYWEEIEKNTPESEKAGLKKEVPLTRMGVGGTELKFQSEIVADQIRHVEHDLEYKREAALAQQMQADELKRSREYVVPMDQFAKEKSMQSLSELGKYAKEKTEAKKLKKNLFVAPENIFPQMGYGSHPEEMIELVEGARKHMTQDLVQGGMSEQKAKSLAKNHIKATLDTQHLGMWKRHFTRKEGESEQAFDKRFDKWYMEEVQKMHKKGIIGNIHIVDGFGKGHTHVVAGQGAFPVVDAVNWLKKNGYDDNMISEAHGNLPVMMTGAWEAFGAGMYGGGSRGGQWTDIQHSYFGRNDPPMYVVGEYRPSEDWQFWSGVPLE